MGIDVRNLPPAYQAQAMRKYIEQERKKGRGPIPSPAAGKYHNQKDERAAASGTALRFDSRKEARRFDELSAMLRAGEI